MLNRLLALIPLLFGITLICFAVIHLAPGDPTVLMANLNPKFHANAAMQAAAQTNVPWPIQYFHWLGNLLRLNFGTSLAPDGLPVWTKIVRALPVTLALNLSGLVVTLLLCLPIAYTAARKPQSLYDHSLTLFLFFLAAAPGFWLALLAQGQFSVTLGWFPLSGLSDGAPHPTLPSKALDLFFHLALPLAVGVLGSLAGLARFLRGSLIETLQQDYILTARAKGASEGRVWKHAFRNALLPLITILGLSLPGIIGGSVILESIFALPGMGQLFYTASMMRDYPTIMGILTFGAVLTLLGNFLADLALVWADPRLRK